MKKCPYCAEDIQEEAVKCKHCGETLAQTEKELKKYANLTGNDRMIAMWCHLSAFSGVIIPFGNFLAPLALWLISRDNYELVDDQGKEALNFQITIFLYSLLSSLLIVLVVGIFMLAAVVLFAVIQVIRGGIAASRGERFRYPLCVRIIQ